MFKATELSKRDIINISDGTKLGSIIDMHFDMSSARIKAIVVAPSRRMGMFRAGRDVVIPWEKIIKFGRDAILVEIDSLPR